MRIDRFLKFLPSIEKTIEAANLDHIVMGLGPTAWLLPHMRIPPPLPSRKSPMNRRSFFKSLAAAAMMTAGRHLLPSSVAKLEAPKPEPEPVWTAGGGDTIVLGAMIYDERSGELVAELAPGEEFHYEGGPRTVVVKCKMQFAGEQVLVNVSDSRAHVRDGFTLSIPPGSLTLA